MLRYLNMSIGKKKQKDIQIHTHISVGYDTNIIIYYYYMCMPCEESMSSGSDCLMNSDQIHSPDKLSCDK